MRWPTIPENKKKRLNETMTHIITAWEKHPEFVERRYFSRIYGFGGFALQLPDCLQQKSRQFLYPQFPYSIIKLKIKDEWHYGLCVCEDYQGWSEQNAGSFALHEVVQLIKKNASGAYVIRGEPEYYGIKIFNSAYEPCHEAIEMKQVGDFATTIIPEWSNDPELKEFNFFSKQHGFSELDLPLVANKMNRCRFSIIRFKHKCKYYYGLRIAEEAPHLLIGENHQEIKYEKIQLLDCRQGNYVVTQRYYGIKIYNNEVFPCDYIYSLPLTKAEEEAELLSNLDIGAEVFTINGFTIISMNPHPGKDLSHYIKHNLQKKNHLDKMHAFLEIAEGSCVSLRRVHSYAIIHRDLNPSNIIFDDSPDNLCKIHIIDYGIAKKGKNIFQNGYSGTPGYFPLYQSAVHKRKSKLSLTNSNYLEFNKKTDYESLGRTLFSIASLVEESYFKRFAQTVLMISLIFADEPKLSIFIHVLPVLKQIKADSERLIALKPNAYQAYNAVFNHHVDQSSVRGLFTMAHDDFERTKQMKSNSLCTSYNDEEFLEIHKNRRKLKSNLQNACLSTAVALLQGYVSWFAVICCFHWRRQHLNLVRFFLKQRPVSEVTLEELASFARLVLEDNSCHINPAGSLARRCCFIYSLTRCSIIENIQAIPRSVN